GPRVPTSADRPCPAVDRHHTHPHHKEHLPMRVHIGGDHASYELHRHLVTWLTEQGHEVVDHGPLEYDPADDFPSFVLRAAEAVAADPDSLGIVMGGSGNGEQMAANKVKGVRAALAWDTEVASLAREHNDARIIS